MAKRTKLSKNGSKVTVELVELSKEEAAHLVIALSMLRIQKELEVKKLVAKYLDSNKGAEYDKYRQLVEKILMLMHNHD